ncbi:methyl-accepting chemotaxis protein [Vibrio mediterranei]|uniref:Methyl-accepting chemotaxis protein n=1 Tax=Vibrio mediterranei TaxID=689 RepID=A0ABX5DE12_9VIBR|nr:methyl-accepting chemotaxis protein [Vibrio mediterranei]PCD88039.1 methyl-accepting chemotaxis protein [Vibrio mediterranei]PRQ67762.1 methyl-accepting chemotaxis protein [Vibrio mediterranei]SBO08290.1 Methyl-accepting chemotaxis protein PctB [Vibrio mediterranei]
MKIKHQLLLLGSISVLAIASMLMSSSYFAKTTDNLTNALTKLSQLEVTLLNLRRNEKDFLLRKDEKYLAKFRVNAEHFRNQQNELQLTLANAGVSLPNQLSAELAAYEQAFTKLVNGYVVLGLNLSQGLSKQFLEVFHQELERNVTRELLQYHDDVMFGNVATVKPTNNPSLNTVGQNVLKQREVIGFAYDQGLLGLTRSNSHKIETDFEDFNAQLNRVLDDKIQTIMTAKWTISVLLLVVIAALITYIVRAINLNVNRLQSTISDIAEHNDLTKRVSVKGNDEIASIGKAVNSLLDNFASLVGNTQRQSSELRSSSTNMEDELENVIHQFHSQSDHTNSMATAVQQMVTTIDEIAQTTHNAADVVNKAADNSQNSRAFVENTVGNIESLSSVLAESNNEIRSLNEHVGKIGGAVHIIQDIAEQTNLLALNAAIEAARAGEQGRGFAVVADEVRALASRTHQSTEEITNLVSAIQAQMTTVVTDIEQCNAQGAETLSASAKLDNALQQISEDMAEIQTNSDQIAAAIEEQGIVMGQVGESITELNEISNDNMSNARNCLDEVKNVSSQTTKMDSAISIFKI